MAGLEIPSWPDENVDTSVSPTPGGLLDGLPEQGPGNSLSLLMDPQQIADIGVPATVSEGATWGAPVAIAAGDPLSQRGAAPDPETYAKQGEMARQLLLNPYDPDGNSEAGGVMYNLGQLAQFHRGGGLDAQRYGASHQYGNYAFGVYNGAAGASLPDVLDWANTYGKYFSTYPHKTQMDDSYKFIPAENVQNITKGYNDYKNGIVRAKP